MRASSLGKFRVVFTEEVLAIVKVEPMPPLEGQTFYLTETAEYVTPASNCFGFLSAQGELLIPEC